MREFKLTRIAPMFVAAAVLVGCAFTVPASAGNFPTHWVAPVSGDWTDPTRWSTNPFYPKNGNPAEIVYDAFIDAPGPGYTVTLDDDVEVNRVVIRSPAALMNQTGHTLDLFFLGLGDVGAGRYRMSDGTINLISLAVGGSGWDTGATGDGMLEVVRGQINFSGERVYVGVGTGTLVVNGPFSRYAALPYTASGSLGTHFIGWGTLGSGVAKFQNRAQVNLGGVVLGELGGRGTMLVESGANVSAGVLEVASGSPSNPAGDGTVMLGGSSLGIESQLSVGSLSVGFAGNGTVIVNGGTLTIRPSPPYEGLSVGSTGTVIVNGGAVHAQRPVTIRTGHFTVNGGNVSATSIRMNQGNFAPVGGTFTLNGGSCSADEVLVTRGHYIQTGGIASLGIMDIDRIGGSSVHPDARLVGGAFDAGYLLLRSGTFTYERGMFGADYLHIPGGRLVTTPGRDKALRVGSLSISGQGRLDLGDNVMLLDSGAAPPLGSIRALLRTGYNNGAWDGPGIISSVAQSTPTHGIGYARPSPLFTPLLVAYTRWGDANVDGAVDLSDFNALASNFGSTDAFWSDGDFNYDGNVNLQDFNRLAAYFGLSAAGPDVTPQDWARLGAAVPEPAALGFTGVAASAAMLIRRRRRAS